MLSEKHWQWIGRIGDAYGLYSLGVAIIGAAATWLAASHDTRDALTPLGWLLFFFVGTGFLIICLAIGVRIVSRAPQKPSHAGTPELQHTAADYRRILEEGCVGAEGESVTVQMDAVKNSLPINSAGKNYQIMISKSGGTGVWVYPESGAKKMSTIATSAAKRSELIDVRTARPLRDSGHLTIGDRVLVEMSDGYFVQALLTGVLYYNAGDDRDEARFKYKVYEPGEFLIPAL
ncbi:MULTISPECIES: hypothetical protein [unclassified Hyphomicrobium]|uniref:hypothetical protein n=1 Tax=unclassified Hyphomicrobium TaxID=2619925 RepID=UPI000213F446|nr:MULTISPECIES: hypothetical protein [unclassified Hyphomicrobium]CCB64933.1 protein of unknown function [Hyphomicrobium sp. MC1]